VSLPGTKVEHYLLDIGSAIGFGDPAGTAISPGTGACGVRHHAVVRVLLAVLLVVVVAPTAVGAIRPQVRLMTASPASVAGTGFKARERVTVTVTGTSSPLAKSVVTGAKGGFVAHFARAVSAAACRQIAIVAVGAGGDRAAWKSPQRACGPPPGP
jgi:hypothetical protein